MEVGAIIDFYHVRNIYVEQFFYVILMILTGNLLFSLFIILMLQFRF